MFNSDLDVISRLGFPKTADRIREALQQKNELIKQLQTKDESNTTPVGKYTIETYDQGGDFWCFKVYHEDGTLIAHSTDGYRTKESAVHNASTFLRWYVV